MVAVKHLPASSLLETIVASVVLLIVFAVSLETVVRLTVGSADGLVCAEANYHAACELGKIREGAYGKGTTKQIFDWGSLTIRIESYESSLWCVTLTLEIAKGCKKMEYKHLIDPGDFGESRMMREL